MTRLSGIIITLNEARGIERAVESLRPWCDEVLVLDSGSTDGTRDLAARAGARVLERGFTDFVDQKNAAVDAAANDWILSLDGDEELTGDPGVTLSGFDGADTSVIYRIPRRNRYLGGWVDHTGWRRDAPVRLFHRGHARFLGSGTHETVGGEGCRTERLGARILHRPYRDLTHHLEKINRYSSSLAEEMDARGKSGVHLRLVLDPPWKFFRMYVLERGFLMGWRGFVISAMAAVYVFTKYAKLWERRHGRDPS